MEKFQFFGENYGLTPLEKYQNFDFFNFDFRVKKTPFSFLEYQQKRFPGLWSLQ